MSLRIPVAGNDHVQGSLDAAVVLVEYGDYQCPYCGQAAPLVKRLRQRFGNDLCLVFRNFPLTEVHPQALPAAVVAEHAARSGRFWEAHDVLYANQASLGEALYRRIAQALGLSWPELVQAMEDGPELARVQSDLEGGIRSGVNGTPTFFINGSRFEPASGFDELFDAIGAIVDARG